MSNLQVIESEGELVVDSRLVAERLGIQHETFLKTLKKYQASVEKRFGQFRFEIATVTNSVGATNQVKFALLTELQATALMTFSRNTPQVVECKLALVEAFEKAKQVILEKQVPAIAPPLEPLDPAEAELQRLERLTRLALDLDATDYEKSLLKQRVLALVTGETSQPRTLPAMSLGITVSERARALGYRLGPGQLIMAGNFASKFYRKRYGVVPEKRYRDVDGEGKSIYVNVYRAPQDLAILDSAIQSVILATV